MMQMRKRRKERYRWAILMCLALDLITMGSIFYQKLNRRIPDEIIIEQNSEKNLEETLACPMVTFSEAVEASSDGSYILPAQILGSIPFKNIKVTEKPQQSVYVSGDPIGIYLETKGVLIIDTGEIYSENGAVQTPARDLVKAGDYIMAFNHQKVSSKRELIEDLAELETDEVTLDIRRNNETIPVCVTPVRDSSGAYKLGIWVRDDTQGIGTLTYKTEDGKFGALGHGISDMDTGGLLDIGGGDLYRAQILGIQKGSKGSPGELAGLIHYQQDQILGEIQNNTKNGIFGRIRSGAAAAEGLSFEKYPVAYKQELQVGPCRILCKIEDQIGTYDAEITHIDLNHEDSNKSFIIRVTDPRLLELTGGIVQGMSGSPILQNGKFAGAITHVFVQDAASGYGIFAETMLGEETGW